LRTRGHDVTVLAPSSRARDLLAGRRALQRGDDLDVIAVGPSVPLSRRTNMGVPVAVRANLRLGLTKGRFDVVPGFGPGAPGRRAPAAPSSPAIGWAIPRGGPVPTVPARESTLCLRRPPRPPTPRAS